MKLAFFIAAFGIARFAGADQAYTKFVVQQYTSRQTGNVGAAAITSDGDFAAQSAPGASIQVSRSTVFEVGSTTKTFTTLVAELLAGQGKLSMADTLGKYVNVSLAPAVASITLTELATHTSGLARMPTNIDPQNPDPMHAYTYEDMYRYLGGLTSVGPKKFLYSNTGFGLLGWITVLVSGKNWEDLVKELVVQPLQMTDTSVTLSSDQKSRLAPPNAQGRPSGPTTFTDVMVGAGGLRSTAPDMLQYAKAFAGLTEVSADMRSAMDRMLKSHAADEFPDLKGQVDEAFQQYTMRQATAFWKDGATAGYNCYIAYVPKKSAVFVVANTAAVSADSATALAGNLLLAGPPPTHSPVSVPPSTLQSYAGQYTQPAGPHDKQPTQYSVSASQNGISISSSSAPTVQLSPFQNDAFYAQSNALEAYFEKDELIMFYSGQDRYATRGYNKISTSMTYGDWLHSRSLAPQSQPTVVV